MNIENEIKHPSPKHIYIAVAIVIAALMFHAYIGTREGAARVEQVRQDVAPIHKEAAEEKKQAVNAEKDNQASLALALVALSKQQQQPIRTEVDYQRIEAMIAARMDGSKATVTAGSLPDAPVATMPAKALNDYMSKCDAESLKLLSCTTTTTNLQKALEAEVKDHAADKHELEVTKTQIKGGSFVHRMKSNSKWMVVGGVATAVTIKILSNRKR